MMKGKGRERGFLPNAGRMTAGTRGPPPSPSGVGGEPAPGVALTGDTTVPSGAEGGEKRKSEAISPLFTVNGKGVPKRGETGLACEGGTDCSDITCEGSNDQGTSSPDDVGITPSPPRRPVR